MTIFFIRHTSVAVPQGVCYGNTDVPLAETFEQEAACTKSELQRRSDMQFDAVFTSPLTRAHRLAAYCGFPEAIHDERIKEYNFGEWEMKSYDYLYANDPRFAQWCEDYMNVRTPGGENGNDQMDRIVQFIEEKKQMGYQRIAVFCHGGVMAIANIYTGSEDAKSAFANIPPFGSVLKIEL